MGIARRTGFEIGKLGGYGFTQDQGPGLPQQDDHLGLGTGKKLGGHLGPGPGHKPGHVEDILDGHQQAIEWRPLVRIRKFFTQFAGFLAQAAKAVLLGQHGFHSAIDFGHAGTHIFNIIDRIQTAAAQGFGCGSQ
jgi:hypothetical protein